MGFLSDLATLLNAGLSVSDIKDLARINATAQITPEAPTADPPASDPPAADPPDADPPDADPPASDPPAPTQAETAILTEISKLTSAIQAANILNSAKTGLPKTETVDDILAANISRMGGGE